MELEDLQALHHHPKQCCTRMRRNLHPFHQLQINVMEASAAYSQRMHSKIALQFTQNLEWKCQSYVPVHTQALVLVKEQMKNMIHAQVQAMLVFPCLHLHSAGAALIATAIVAKTPHNDHVNVPPQLKPTTRVCSSNTLLKMHHS